MNPYMFTADPNRSSADSVYFRDALRTLVFVTSASELYSLPIFKWMLAIPATVNSRIQGQATTVQQTGPGPEKHITDTKNSNEQAHEPCVSKEKAVRWPVIPQTTSKLCLEKKKKKDGEMEWQVVRSSSRNNFF